MITYYSSLLLTRYLSSSSYWMLGKWWSITKSTTFLITGNNIKILPIGFLYKSFGVRENRFICQKWSNHDIWHMASGHLQHSQNKVCLICSIFPIHSFIYPSFHQCQLFNFSSFVHPFILTYIHPSIHFPFFHPFFHPSIHLSIHQCQSFILSSIHHPFIHPPMSVIHLFIYSSIHLFIHIIRPYSLYVFLWFPFLPQ